MKALEKLRLLVGSNLISPSLTVLLQGHQGNRRNGILGQRVMRGHEQTTGLCMCMCQVHTSSLFHCVNVLTAYAWHGTHAHCTVHMHTLTHHSRYTLGTETQTVYDAYLLFVLFADSTSSPVRPAAQVAIV